MPSSPENEDFLAAGQAMADAEDALNESSFHGTTDPVGDAYIVAREAGQFVNHLYRNPHRHRRHCRCRSQHRDEQRHGFPGEPHRGCETAANLSRPFGVQRRVGTQASLGHPVVRSWNGLTWNCCAVQSGMCFPNPNPPRTSKGDPDRHPLTPTPQKEAPCTPRPPSPCTPKNPVSGRPQTPTGGNIHEARWLGIFKKELEWLASEDDSKNPVLFEWGTFPEDVVGSLSQKDKEEILTTLQRGWEKIADYGTWHSPWDWLDLVDAQRSCSGALMLIEAHLNLMHAHTYQGPSRPGDAGCHPRSRDPSHACVRVRWMASTPEHHH